MSDGLLSLLEEPILLAPAPVLDRSRMGQILAPAPWMMKEPIVGTLKGSRVGPAVLPKLRVLRASRWLSLALASLVALFLAHSLHAAVGENYADHSTRWLAPVTLEGVTGPMTAALGASAAWLLAAGSLFFSTLLFCRPALGGSVASSARPLRRAPRCRSSSYAVALLLCAVWFSPASADKSMSIVSGPDSEAVVGQNLRDAGAIVVTLQNNEGIGGAWEASVGLTVTVAWSSTTNTLAGTTAATTDSSGQASFTLSAAVTASDETGITLTFSSTGYTSAVSSALRLYHYMLTVTSVPSEAAATASIAIVVAVQHTAADGVTASGVATGFTGNLAISATSDTTGLAATLVGTTTTSASSGTHTFTLSITAAGGYTFSVSSSDQAVKAGSISTSSVDVFQWNVILTQPPVDAAVLKKLFTKGLGPCNTLAGACADAADKKMVVEVRRSGISSADTAFNGDVSVSLLSTATAAADSNQEDNYYLDAALQGTTTVTASNGVAEFPDVTISRWGKYSLSFGCSNSAQCNVATSATFTLYYNKLRWKAGQSPQSRIITENQRTIIVEAIDDEDNVDTTFTDDLQIVDLLGTSTELSSTSGALTSTSTPSALTATSSAGAATFENLKILVDLSSVSTVSVTLTVRPTNPVASMSTRIPSTHTLSGAYSITKGQLHLSKSGYEYMSKTVLPTVSVTIKGVGSDSGRLMTSTEVRTTNLVLTIENVNCGSDGASVVSLNAATEVSGTMTAVTSSGAASFAGLKINRMSGGGGDDCMYRYKVSGGSLMLDSEDNSQHRFDIKYKVIMGTDPVDKYVLQPQGNVVVNILHGDNSAVTDFVGVITATITTSATTAFDGQTPALSAVSGGTSVAAVGGTVTYNGLKVSFPGRGYTLVFKGATTQRESRLDEVTSSAFNCYGKLAVAVSPSNMLAATTIPSLAVDVVDHFGTKLSSVGASSSITVVIATNGGSAEQLSSGAPGTGVLSGTMTKVVTAGTSTFSDLVIDRNGDDYTLTFTATTSSIASHASVTTSSFDISYTIAITDGPSPPAADYLLGQNKEDVHLKHETRKLQLSVFDGASTRVAVTDYRPTNPIQLTLFNSGIGPSNNKDSPYGATITVTAGATNEPGVGWCCSPDNWVSGVCTVSFSVDYTGVGYKIQIGQSNSLLTGSTDDSASFIESGVGGGLKGYGLSQLFDISANFATVVGPPSEVQLNSFMSAALFQTASSTDIYIQAGGATLSTAATKLDSYGTTQFTPSWVGAAPNPADLTTQVQGQITVAATLQGAQVTVVFNAVTYYFLDPGQPLVVKLVDALGNIITDEKAHIVRAKFQENAAYCTGTETGDADCGDAEAGTWSDIGTCPEAVATVAEGTTDAKAYFYNDVSTSALKPCSTGARAINFRSTVNADSKATPIEQMRTSMPPFVIKSQFSSWSPVSSDAYLVTAVTASTGIIGGTRIDVNLLTQGCPDAAGYCKFVVGDPVSIDAQYRGEVVRTETVGAVQSIWVDRPFPVTVASPIFTRDHWLNLQSVDVLANGRVNVDWSTGPVSYAVDWETGVAPAAVASLTIDCVDESHLGQVKLSNGRIFSNPAASQQVSISPPTMFVGGRVDNPPPFWKGETGEVFWKGETNKISGGFTIVIASVDGDGLKSTGGSATGATIRLFRDGSTSDGIVTANGASLMAKAGTGGSDANAVAVGELATCIKHQVDTTYASQCTAVPVDGITKFENVRLSKPGLGYVVEFVSTAALSVTSAPFDVIPYLRVRSDALKTTELLADVVIDTAVPGAAMADIIIELVDADGDILTAQTAASIPPAPTVQVRLLGRHTSGGSLSKGVKNAAYFTAAEQTVKLTAGGTMLEKTGGTPFPVVLDAATPLTVSDKALLYEDKTGTTSNVAALKGDIVTFSITDTSPMLGTLNRRFDLTKDATDVFVSVFCGQAFIVGWIDLGDTGLAVTGVTKEAGAVVACAGHTFVAGDVIFFSEVDGMTALNLIDNSGVKFKVQAAGIVPGTSFILTDMADTALDTSDYVAFGTSGTVFEYKPPLAAVTGTTTVTVAATPPSARGDLVQVTVGSAVKQFADPGPGLHGKVLSFKDPGVPIAPVAMVNGLATFTELTVDMPGENYVLEFSDVNGYAEPTTYFINVVGALLSTPDQLTDAAPAAAAAAASAVVLSMPAHFPLFKTPMLATPVKVHRDGAAITVDTFVYSDITWIGVFPPVTDAAGACDGVDCDELTLLPPLPGYAGGEVTLSSGHKFEDPGVADLVAGLPSQANFFVQSADLLNQKLDLFTPTSMSLQIVESNLDIVESPKGSLLGSTTQQLGSGGIPGKTLVSQFFVGQQAPEESMYQLSIVGTGDVLGTALLSSAEAIVRAATLATSGLTQATSSVFRVVYKLVVLQQPKVSVDGYQNKEDFWAIQSGVNADITVRLSIQDANGRAIKYDRDQQDTVRPTKVTASLGDSIPMPAGVTAAALVAGVETNSIPATGEATFLYLSIDKPGRFTLKFDGANLLTAETEPFELKYVVKPVAASACEKPAIGQEDDRLMNHLVGDVVPVCEFGIYDNADTKVVDSQLAVGSVPAASIAFGFLPVYTAAKRHVYLREHALNDRKMISYATPKNFAIGDLVHYYKDGVLEAQGHIISSACDAPGCTNLENGAPLDRTEGVARVIISTDTPAHWNSLTLDNTGVMKVLDKTDGTTVKDQAVGGQVWVDSVKLTAVSNTGPWYPLLTVSGSAPQVADFFGNGPAYGFCTTLKPCADHSQFSPFQPIAATDFSNIFDTNTNTYPYPHETVRIVTDGLHKLVMYKSVLYKVLWETDVPTSTDAILIKQSLSGKVTLHAAESRFIMPSVHLDIGSLLRAPYPVNADGTLIDADGDNAPDRSVLQESPGQGVDSTVVSVPLTRLKLRATNPCVAANSGCKLYDEVYQEDPGFRGSVIAETIDTRDIRVVTSRLDAAVGISYTAPLVLQQHQDDFVVGDLKVLPDLWIEFLGQRYQVDWVAGTPAGAFVAQTLTWAVSGAQVALASNRVTVTDALNNNFVFKDPGIPSRPLTTTTQLRLFNDKTPTMAAFPDNDDAGNRDAPYSIKTVIGFRQSFAEQTDIIQTLGTVDVSDDVTEAFIRAGDTIFGDSVGGEVVQAESSGGDLVVTVKASARETLSTNPAGATVRQANHLSARFLPTDVQSTVEVTKSTASTFIFNQAHVTLKETVTVMADGVKFRGQHLTGLTWKNGVVPPATSTITDPLTAAMVDSGMQGLVTPEGDIAFDFADKASTVDGSGQTLYSGLEWIDGYGDTYNPTAESWGAARPGAVSLREIRDVTVDGASRKQVFVKQSSGVETNFFYMPNKATITDIIDTVDSATGAVTRQVEVQTYGVSGSTYTFTDPTAQQGSVRFLHSQSNGESVEVMFEDDPLWIDFPGDLTNSFTSVPAGVHTFSITSIQPWVQGTVLLTNSDGSGQTCSFQNPNAPQLGAFVGRRFYMHQLVYINSMPIGVPKTVTEQPWQQDAFGSIPTVQLTFDRSAASLKNFKAGSAVSVRAYGTVDAVETPTTANAVMVTTTMGQFSLHHQITICRHSETAVAEYVQGAVCSSWTPMKITTQVQLATAVTKVPEGAGMTIDIIGTVHGVEDSLVAGPAGAAVATANVILVVAAHSGDFVKDAPIWIIDPTVASRQEASRMNQKYWLALKTDSHAFNLAQTFHLGSRLGCETAATPCFPELARIDYSVSPPGLVYNRVLYVVEWIDGEPTTTELLKFNFNEMNAVVNGEVRMSEVQIAVNVDNNPSVTCKTATCPGIVKFKNPNIAVQASAWKFLNPPSSIHDTTQVELLSDPVLEFDSALPLRQSGRLDALFNQGLKEFGGAVVQSLAFKPSGFGRDFAIQPFSDESFLFMPTAKFDAMYQFATATQVQHWPTGGAIPTFSFDLVDFEGNSLAAVVPQTPGDSPALDIATLQATIESFEDKTLHDSGWTEEEHKALCKKSDGSAPASLVVYETADGLEKIRLRFEEVRHQTISQAYEGDPLLNDMIGKNVAGPKFLRVTQGSRGNALVRVENSLGAVTPDTDPDVCARIPGSLDKRCSWKTPNFYILNALSMAANPDGIHITDSLSFAVLNCQRHQLPYWNWRTEANRNNEMSYGCAAENSWDKSCNAGQMVGCTNANDGVIVDIKDADGVPVTLNAFPKTATVALEMAVLPGCALGSCLSEPLADPPIAQLWATGQLNEETRPFLASGSANFQRLSIDHVGTFVLRVTGDGFVTPAPPLDRTTAVKLPHAVSNEFQIICPRGYYNAPDAGQNSMCFELPAGGTFFNLKDDTCDGALGNTGGNSIAKDAQGNRAERSAKSGCLPCAENTYSDKLFDMPTRGVSVCQQCPPNTLTAFGLQANRAMPGGAHLEDCVCDKGFEGNANFAGASITSADNIWDPADDFKSSFFDTTTGKAVDPSVLSIGNPDGGESCAPCAIAKYGEDFGAVTCTLCEGGKYGATVGALDCVNCETSTYSLEGSTECEDCPPGYEGTEEGMPTFTEACAACVEGKYGDEFASDACKDCQIGTASKDSGRETFCPGCTPGTYADVPGLQECTFCDAGKISLKKAQDCFFCGIGKFSRSGDANCTDCLLGTFTNDEGSANCDACPIDTYQDEVGMDKCDECVDYASEYKGVAATSAFNCSCKTGYTRSGIRPDLFLECAPPEACVPGPAEWRKLYDPARQQMPRELMPAQHGCDCSLGYDPNSLMCGSCLNLVNDGYTQPKPLGWYKLKGRCMPCRNIQDPTFIIIMIIFVLIGGVFFMKFAKYLGKMGSLKIFINFMQITAIFAGFGIPWPPVMMEMFALMSIFSFNIEAASPECQMKLNYAQKWIGFMFVPLIIYGLFSLVLIFAYVRSAFATYFGKSPIFQLLLPAQSDDDVVVHGVYSDIQIVNADTLQVRLRLSTLVPRRFAPLVGDVVEIDQQPSAEFEVFKVPSLTDQELEDDQPFDGIVDEEEDEPQKRSCCAALCYYGCCCCLCRSRRREVKSGDGEDADADIDEVDERTRCKYDGGVYILTSKKYPHPDCEDEKVVRPHFMEELAELKSGGSWRLNPEEDDPPECMVCSSTSNTMASAACVYTFFTKDLLVWLYGFFTKPTEKGQLTTLKNSVSQRLLNISTMLYIFVCGKALEPLDCNMKDDGNWYLDAESSVMCDASRDEVFAAVQPFAYSFFILYVVGIPLLIGGLLVSNLNDLDQEAQQESLGNVYLQYERYYWWWELTVIGRKLMLVLVEVLLNQLPVLQLAVCLVILLFTLLLQTLFTPFEKAYLDGLEVSCVGAEIMTVMCGLIFITKLPEETLWDVGVTKNEVGYFIVIIVLMVVFLGIGAMYEDLSELIVSEDMVSKQTMCGELARKSLDCESADVVAKWAQIRSITEDQLDAFIDVFTSLLGDDYLNDAASAEYTRMVKAYGLTSVAEPPAFPVAFVRDAADPKGSAYLNPPMDDTVRNVVHPQYRLQLPHALLVLHMLHTAATCHERERGDSDEPRLQHRLRKIKTLHALEVQHIFEMRCAGDMAPCGFWATQPNVPAEGVLDQEEREEEEEEEAERKKTSCSCCCMCYSCCFYSCCCCLIQKLPWCRPEEDDKKVFYTDVFACFYPPIDPNAELETTAEGTQKPPDFNFMLREMDSNLFEHLSHFDPNVMPAHTQKIYKNDATEVQSALYDAFQTILPMVDAVDDDGEPVMNEDAENPQPVGLVQRLEVMMKDPDCNPRITVSGHSYGSGLAMMVAHHIAKRFKGRKGIMGFCKSASKLSVAMRTRRWACAQLPPRLFDSWKSVSSLQYYSFGSPAFAGPKFAKAFAKDVPLAYRFMCNRDPVPLVSPEETEGKAHHVGMDIVLETAVRARDDNDSWLKNPVHLGAKTLANATEELDDKGNLNGDQTRLGQVYTQIVSGELDKVDSDSQAHDVGRMGARRRWNAVSEAVDASDKKAMAITASIAKAYKEVLRGQLVRTQETVTLKPDYNRALQLWALEADPKEVKHYQLVFAGLKGWVPEEAQKDEWERIVQLQMPAGMLFHNRDAADSGASNRTDRPGEFEIEDDDQARRLGITRALLDDLRKACTQLLEDDHQATVEQLLDDKPEADRLKKTLYDFYMLRVEATQRNKTIEDLLADKKLSEELNLSLEQLDAARAMSAERKMELRKIASAWHDAEGFGVDVEKLLDDRVEAGNLGIELAELYADREEADDRAIQLEQLYRDRAEAKRWRCAELDDLYRDHKEASRLQLSMEEYFLMRELGGEAKETEGFMNTDFVTKMCDAFEGDTSDAARHLRTDRVMQVVNWVAKDRARDVNLAVGLEDGTVLDGQLSGSNGVGTLNQPASCRLNHDYGFVPMTSDDYYGVSIQVQFPSLMHITAIGLQGRPQSKFFVTSLSIYSSTDTQVKFAKVANKELRRYRRKVEDLQKDDDKVMDACPDADTVTRIPLNPPLEAACVRIHPEEWQDVPAMRLELYGCEASVLLDVDVVMGAGRDLRAMLVRSQDELKEVEGFQPSDTVLELFESKKAAREAGMSLAQFFRLSRDAKSYGKTLAQLREDKDRAEDLGVTLEDYYIVNEDACKLGVSPDQYRSIQTRSKAVGRTPAQVLADQAEADSNKISIDKLYMDRGKALAAGVTVEELWADESEAERRKITLEQLYAVKGVKNALSADGVSVTVSELLAMKPVAEREGVELKAWALKKKEADDLGVDTAQLRNQQIESAMEKTADDLAMWD